MRTTKQNTKNKCSDENRSEQLLRLNQIVGKDGLLPISRATFYELVKRGDLPKPIKLAARISCWRKADILDFINDSEVAGAGFENV